MCDKTYPKIFLVPLLALAQFIFFHHTRPSLRRLSPLPTFYSYSLFVFPCLLLHVTLLSLISLSSVLTHPIMLRSPFSTTLAAWSPAYAAALALVTIQVGIGIIYKVAQKGGRSGPPNPLCSNYRMSGKLTNPQLYLFNLILHYHIRIPQMRLINIPVLPRMPQAAFCEGFCLSAGSRRSRAIIARREG